MVTIVYRYYCDIITIVSFYGWLKAMAFDNLNYVLVVNVGVECKSHNSSCSKMSGAELYLIFKNVILRTVCSVRGESA